MEHLSDCLLSCCLVYFSYMGLFLKIFIGFWLIWILWYITGGPLRDDVTKPYVRFNENGQLENVGTSTHP